MKFLSLMLCFSILLAVSACQNKTLGSGEMPQRRVTEASKSGASESSQSNNQTLTPQAESPLPFLLPSSQPTSLILLPDVENSASFLQARVLGVYSNSAVIRWEPFKDASYYQVFVNNSSQTGRLTSVVHTLSKLSPDTRFMIQVVAFDNTDKKIALSSLIEIKTQPNVSRGGGASSGAPVVISTPAPIETPIVKFIEAQQSIQYEGINYASQALAFNPVTKHKVFSLVPGIVRSVDENQELSWERDIGEQIATSPVISTTGDIFIGTLDGRVLSLSSDGYISWELFLEDNAFIVGLALNEDQSLLYATTHTGSVFAVDIYGGYLRWQRPLTSEFENASTLSAYGDILIGDTSGSWFLIDHETERLSWTYSSPITEKTAMGIALEDRYYLTFETSGLRCVNKQGYLLWSFDESGVVGSPVIDEKGYVYVATTDSKIVIFDALGKIAKRIALPQMATGHMLLDSEGNLYVLTANKLLVYNSEAYQIIEANLDTYVPGALTADHNNLWLLSSLGQLISFPLESAFSKEALWPKTYSNASNTNMFKREAF